MEETPAKFEESHRPPPVKFSGADLMCASTSFDISDDKKPKALTFSDSLNNYLAAQEAAPADEEDGSTTSVVEEKPQQVDSTTARHIQAANTERELRDAQQIKKVRERNDKLQQNFVIPAHRQVPPARGKGYTVLASPRSAREVMYTPEAPTRGRWRKQWWHGRVVPQTARSGARKLAPVSKKAPRTPKQCDSWMGKMQTRCLQNNLCGETISKVLGLAWRKCSPPPTPVPRRYGAAPVCRPVVPRCEKPLRTLSARRRSVELSSDAAVFAFNKARTLEEVWTRFCDAGGTKMDLPRLKRALLVMGIRVGSRPVAKSLHELIYKLERMDTEKATKDDFLRLVQQPAIEKMLDENILHGTIQLKKQSYMPSSGSKQGDQVFTEIDQSRSFD